MDTVGGLLGDKPLICGGGSMFAHHKCSVIGTGDNIAIEMTEPRYWAAGATWGRNNEFFVISGGKDDRSQWLNSTELISLDTLTTTKGGDLPSETWGHSMVAFNDRVMVIGGSGYSSSGPNDYLDTTYYGYAGVNTIQWESGPSLVQARRWHASAVLGQFVVTAGGYHMPKPGVLTSVEIMDIENFPSHWRPGKLITYVFYEICNIQVKSYMYFFLKGPILPDATYGHQLVTVTDESPFSEQLLLVGGYVFDNPSKNVLALDCIGCNWRYIGELQRPRIDFVAMAVPRNMTLDC